MLVANGITMAQFGQMSEDEKFTYIAAYRKFLEQKLKVQADAEEAQQKQLNEFKIATGGGK